MVSVTRDKTSSSHKHIRHFLTCESAEVRGRSLEGGRGKLNTGWYNLIPLVLDKWRRRGHAEAVAGSESIYQLHDYNVIMQLLHSGEKTRARRGEWGPGVNRETEEKEGKYESEES